MQAQAKYIVIAIVIVLTITFLGFFIDKSSLISIKNDTPDYEMVAVEKTKGGWSYEIFYYGKLLIRQDYIPAVKGKQLFSSKRDAEKVGKLVIDKLKSNRSPTITVVDLQQYRIKFEEK